MRRNNQTNTLIMWLVVAGDFVLLNIIIYVYNLLSASMAAWDVWQVNIFYFISNVALMVSEWRFHTTIHRRLVSAGDLLKSIVLLTTIQTVVAYIMMKYMMYWTPVGRILLVVGIVFFVLLVIAWLSERTIIKLLRQMGLNTRTVTLVGSGKELWDVYEQLLEDPTTGYRILGYYADEESPDSKAPWLGTIKGLMSDISKGKNIIFGDEMYVCMSRREGKYIKTLSEVCDSQVTKFYYIPVSVEYIGLNLKKEFINDVEVYTTHESPLQMPLNTMVKRVFDIIVSVVALILTGLIFPIICLIIKKQSPGPIFFKQERTGQNGKIFMCYKFRSMHVNNDADKKQATKNDPRKYPFGDFMRKTNIDELPQFWNVLKGNMSVVGPRPHMVAHTDFYSQKIDRYMVRHFVKPGITGWAQVTGFRGETKELWQMEVRIRRDIWYIEHWSIWLDIRIVWLTFKSMFIHDENAY